MSKSLLVLTQHMLALYWLPCCGDLRFCCSILWHMAQLRYPMWVDAGLVCMAERRCFLRVVHARALESSRALYSMFFSAISTPKPGTYSIVSDMNLFDHVCQLCCLTCRLGTHGNLADTMLHQMPPVRA